MVAHPGPCGQGIISLASMAVRCPQLSISTGDDSLQGLGPDLCGISALQTVHEIIALL